MKRSMDRLVQSPCVRNCCLNEADICLGCFRSLEEITRWGQVNDEAKMQILTLAAARRSQGRSGINDRPADGVFYDE